MEHATLPRTQDESDRWARQALFVWGIFIVLLVMMNGTIPFILGADPELKLQCAEVFGENG